MPFRRSAQEEKERPPLKSRPHFLFFSSIFSLRSAKVQRGSAERCRHGKVTDGERKSELIAPLFGASHCALGRHRGRRCRPCKAHKSKEGPVKNRGPALTLAPDAIKTRASVSAHNATAAVIDALPVFGLQRAAFIPS